MQGLGQLLQRFSTIHILDQRVRNGYPAFNVLVVLKDCDQRSTDRKARAVQRVHKLRFIFFSTSISGFGAAGLEIQTVAARRNLAIRRLARQPYFEVVGLRGGETKVPATKGHHTVRQLQFF